MTEIEAIKALAGTAGGPGSNLAMIAAALTLGIVVIAVALPRILNSIKRDQLDGNVLTRLQTLEEKSIKQDEKIHRQAVRITKLCMLLLKFHGLAVRNNVEVPQEMLDEMVELIKDIKDGE